MGRDALQILVFAGALAAAAASATAQDYAVTTSSGLLETRPAGATAVPVMSFAPSVSTKVVALPFEFHYYGKRGSTLAVSAHGWLVPCASAAFTGGNSFSTAHGQNATSGAFPYTSSGAATDADGVLAPHWMPTSQVGSGLGGLVYSWTTGTAPNRHFVVSWENVEIDATKPRVTFQCMLYETSGRVVFAYGGQSSDWTTASGFVCGLDSPIDARFTAPMSSGTTNVGKPASDFIFDPTLTTFTGTVLFDKIVSDANGIGNSVAANRPLVGCSVELRRASDQLPLDAVADAAADGSFTITGHALPPTATGSLVVVARNAAVDVKTAAGQPTTNWTAVSSVSLATGANLGTRILGASADSLGDLRAAFNVAIDCGAARAWAAPKTNDSIAPIDAYVDASVSAATLYQKANGGTPASLRIGARQALNPDAWDDAVITHAYGRHVLASISLPPTTAYDDRFDAVTDVQNAFAEGFGWWLWAAISGSSTAVDGINSTSAVVHDLESPTITVRKGPDVAGCVAAALYDLLDSANETGDSVDGSLAPDRVLHVSDFLSVDAPPSTAGFLQIWVIEGYDAPSITRTFIANGVLADDSYEPNDSQAEAAPLGAAGVKKTGLVLNPFDEDWYSVTLPAPAASLVAGVKFDGAASAADVGVEIRDAAGAFVASWAGYGDVVSAASNPPPAGTYRVGVKHLSGNTVAAYTLQVFVPPSMDAAPIRDWTVGRPYDIALGVKDGVAPYVVQVASGDLPPGIGVRSSDFHAAGTPSQVGQFPLTLKLTDGGDPANVVFRTQLVTIHPAFRIDVPDFVGFPANRTIDATLPTSGGTPPIALLVTSGALPSGLAFDANSLHVTGSAIAGDTSLGLGGVDAAGDSHYLVTRVVVAPQASGKNTPSDLAQGSSACGWWFDAVEGSTVSFNVVTAKGGAKRDLEGTLLAPDRSAMAATMKSKPGALSGAKIVCPLSGRYYLVASGPNGPATRLLATVVVAPPKSGKGGAAKFASGATTSFDVGALPGATLALKFAGDKRAGLVAKVVSVVDPNGVEQSFASFLKATSTGGTLTMPLPTAGTWTVTLGATSSAGTPGKLTYSYAIKQPKGATFSAE